MTIDLNVILLHADMEDKQKAHVTTSLTLIDVHDIARSSTTYGVNTFFVAHPSPALRKLGRTLKSHWEEGHGSTYNPNRKDAMERVSLVESLDEAIHHIDLRTGSLPTLLATSAKPGEGRVTFKEMRTQLTDGKPYLLMLGTGHGMSEELLARADMFLEPIDGPTQYNHLSVRSACAIMLDRLLAQ